MFNLYINTPRASAAIPCGFSDPLGGTGFVGPSGLGTTVPCAVHFLENIGRPSDQALASGRVDWNIGPNDRAFLLVQYDHGFQASYTDAISPLFDADSNQPSWQGQLIETHAFGPTATNQILVAGWWQGKIIKLANPSQTLSAFPTTLDWNFTTSTFTNLGGVDNSLPQGRNATRFQISEDFVKTWGKQQFGLGVNFLRAYVTDFAYASNAIGQLIPLTLDAILLLHFGTFQIVALLWQSLGVKAEPIMSAPLRSTSLGEFWGKRWNLGFRQLSHELIFRPLYRPLGADAAGFLVFVASGLLHDLVISLPARGGYGLPTLYFLLQGTGMTIEHSRFGKRVGLGQGLRGWCFMMVFLAAPVFWLFHPWFVLRVILPFMHAIHAL